MIARIVVFAMLLSACTSNVSPIPAPEISPTVTPAVEVGFLAALDDRIAELTDELDELTTKDPHLQVEINISILKRELEELVAVREHLRGADRLPSDSGVGKLEDGRHLAFVVEVHPEDMALTVDLALWFEGREANLARGEAGRLDMVGVLPREGSEITDFHIRNDDPATFDLVIAPDVRLTSVFYDYRTDPDLENDPITLEQFLGVMSHEGVDVRDSMRSSPWWVTLTNGRVVALDEQYVP